MRCTERPHRARARRALRRTLALGLAALAACQTHGPQAPVEPAASASAPVASAPIAGARPPAVTADDYQRRIAERLVAANPGRTYLTPAPDPLLAIPVLEIEVDADGNVRDIQVKRVPADEDTRDTVQLAIDAVRRAAPFGDASHVPRPWKFTQIFLFDDERRFKPQRLD